MATTPNVLTREKNAFEQQGKSASTQPSKPSTATRTTKRKRKRKRKRNRGDRLSSRSTSSKEVLPEEAKRPADKPSGRIVEDFTLYWNSKKDTNSILILNNSAQRSKKLLKFHFGKCLITHGLIEGEVHSCTVCIDGIEIVTQLGKSTKMAKQRCADAAYKILKERQPTVDTLKGLKKNRKKKGQASQEKLPALKSTKIKITKDSNGRTRSISTVGQKRQSSDVAVGLKETAKKSKLFIKENTSVEKVSCSSGQDQLSPPTTNLYPEIPKENLGHQLLKRMGWNGGGLGREGNEGCVEPVMHAMIRRRQGLGVELGKQPGRKMSNQVRNIEPSETTKSVSSQSTSKQPICEPFSAITIAKLLSNIKSSTATSQSSCNIEPSAVTAIKPVCNVKSSATAPIQPFVTTTSKYVNIIQPSFPTPRLSVGNINQPSAVTTNKLVSNFVKPLAEATMKPVCNIMPSATTTIQPAHKTSQLVIDVDMLFKVKPTSTNLASNGAAPHLPSMSNQLVFKPKTTVSPVPSKPVASNVKASLPILSNSVRNMLFQPTSTQSKMAKQRCPDAAYKILKERQPTVDTLKGLKKNRKKKGQASQEKLPALKSTKIKITKDSNGRTRSISTVGQKRQSSDVAVGLKETAKKSKLFIKENTSVEKVSCSSGQDQLSPPTTNLYPEIPKENLGHQLLKRMGWNGGGLGREGNEGCVEPVMHAMIRRRQGLGVELGKQPGRKMSNQVRNIEPSETTKSVSSQSTSKQPICEPFSAITIAKLLSNIKSSTATSQSSCNIEPSAVTAIKPVCNVKSSATAPIQPFVTTTSKYVNIIQPSFPTPRLSVGNINQPSAVTTNKLVSNFVKPLAEATMKPVCNIMPSATTTIQPAHKTSQLVIDVDMLFKVKPTSTNLASNGAAPHLPSMSNQLVFKPKTTVSPVPSKPVASNVKASLPILSNSVRNMLFQPTSTQSVRNGMSGASKSLIDKLQLSHVTSKPVIENAIRNVKIETSVQRSLLNTVLNFLKSSQKELRLSDLLTRESRFSLFRLCDAHGLQFQSFIKAKKRSIIISKPED